MMSIGSILPFPAHKPSKIIGFKAKQPSLLERHVQWLKKDHAKLNLLSKILQVVEIVFALLSVIAIPILIKAVKISNRIESVKKFNEAVAKQTPPNQQLEIELKSDTCTFTHTHEIILENGFLWSRLRHSNSAWRPFYFDGFQNNKKPIFIHADGANLIVIDEDRKVHYKKIIREYHSHEIDSKNKRAQEFIEGTDVDLANHPYIVVDKIEKNNWKKKWFTLPVLSLLVQPFKKSKKLTLPAHPLAIAISHRGKYNNYYEDGVGVKHPCSTGVTTLFLLEKNGKIIRKYDPWSPRFAKMDVHVPETSTAAFRAINMDAASSHLMLLGYEITKNPEGQGTKHQLVVKTKLADLDTEGWNPGLKYDYMPHPNNPSIRVVGETSWRTHSFTFNAGERVTKNISIIQTGEGNDEREIRIEGWNAQGIKGYFYKKVNEQAWQFKALNLTISNSPLAFEIKDEKRKFKTTVCDYESKSVHFKNLKNEDNPQIALKNFGIGNFDAKLNIKTANQEYNLILHRKKTLKNFIGIEGENYDLIVPQEFHQDPYLHKLFSGKKVMRVSVSTKKISNEICLKNFAFSITVK